MRSAAVIAGGAINQSEPRWIIFVLSLQHSVGIVSHNASRPAGHFWTGPFHNTPVYRCRYNAFVRYTRLNNLLRVFVFRSFCAQHYVNSYLSSSWAGFNWWEAWGEIKIEGFGGRPPFGGRPGALGPMGPLNPALSSSTDQVRWTFVIRREAAC